MTALILRAWRLELRLDLTTRSRAIRGRAGPGCVVANRARSTDRVQRIADLDAVGWGLITE